MADKKTATSQGDSPSNDQQGSSRGFQPEDRDKLAQADYGGSLQHRGEDTAASAHHGSGGDERREGSQNPIEKDATIEDAETPDVKHTGP